VWELDPDLPLFDIQTLDTLLAQVRWNFFFPGSIFAVFALIALVVSAVGLYAVTAYLVTQRTREIGVRMALGAQPLNVLALIGWSVCVRILVGLVIGMAGALAVGRLMRALLARTSPNDPTTMVLVAALMLAVALGACFFPARRAMRLDPATALRHE
jgi:putative ABC transport system permease protein